MDQPTPQVRPLSNYSLAQLHEELTAMDEAVAAAKVRKAVVVDELEARFRLAIDAGYVLVGKVSGTLKLPSGDAGFRLGCEIEKDVKWDSKKLLAAAGGMPWAQFTAIFKLTLEIPAKIWAGLEAGNPELAAKLKDARTVKYTPKPPKLLPVEG